MKVKWGGKFKGKALRWRRGGNEVHGSVHKNSVPGKYPVTVPICQRRSGVTRPTLSPVHLLLLFLFSAQLKVGLYGVLTAGQTYLGCTLCLFILFYGGYHC